jgi:cytoskeletal protein CcmA (bactofilin family)
VIILSTGFVLGNITTPRLIMEEGVIFNGSCKVTTPAVPDNGRAAPPNGQKVAMREAVAVQDQKR